MGSPSVASSPIVLAVVLGALLFAGVGALIVHLVEGDGGTSAEGTVEPSHTGPSLEGKAMEKDDFTRPRPAAICLYLDGGDCQPRQLLDQAEPQEVRVDAPGPIGELELEVLTVYPPRVADADNRMAIREVTLYAEE